MNSLLETENLSQNRTPGLAASFPEMGSGIGSKPDYPAAHSMDTQWYAVDKDGYVAVFDSCEAGAVPESVPTLENLDLMSKLAEFATPCEALYDLAGRLTPITESHHDGVPPENQVRHARDIPLLMFLNSLETVRGELESGLAQAVKSTEHHAVIFKKLPPEVSRRIHDAGTCLACFYHFQATEEDLQDPAAIGLFHFSHDTCENWMTGPYNRLACPNVPLDFLQLPQALKEMLKKAWLPNVSFATTPHFQPIDQVSCATWDPAYLASDWKTIRPVPGREGEFSDACQEMAGDTRFVFDPPLGPGTMRKE